MANRVIIKGAPYDRNSSFLRGGAMAPSRIREAFWGDSANSCTEDGFDIVKTELLEDSGNLEVKEYHSIGDQLIPLLRQGNKVITLGGDHSISYPLIKAYAQIYPTINIVQIDAHTDLYDNFDGDKYSHACPFARVMEEKIAVRLVQVGIRSVTPHTRAQADRFGVEMYEMRNWEGVPDLVFEGPVYISLDLDGLDPAFAPGVSHHEPGGLTVREVLQLLKGIKGEIVGADIVELNPIRDLVDMTAMVGAKFLRELAGIMMKQN